ILTGRHEERCFSDAMDLGVQGYILKDSAAKVLLQAVKRVAAGEHFFCPLVAKFLINRHSQSVAQRTRLPRFGSLTARQRVVLKRIAEDNTSKQIAEALGISYRTVENHRAQICS